MTRNEFWQKIISELLEDNFAIMLYKERDIDGWGGWCEAGKDGREFVVALDHPMGFETAIHEYCHYLQWKNKPELWNKVDNTYNVLIVIVLFSLVFVKINLYVHSSNHKFLY